jgi:hypothetical protein
MGMWDWLVGKRRAHQVETTDANTHSDKGVEIA